jgi:hypothetical protein
LTIDPRTRQVAADVVAKLAVAGREQKPDLGGSTGCAWRGGGTMGGSVEVFIECRPH